VLRATIATLRRHPARLLMSIVAVALAVTFVTGTLIFTGILSGTLDRLRLGALPDVLVAQDSSTVPDVTSQPAVVLTSTDIAAMRDTPGVRAVHGMVSEPGVQVLDQDKRVVSEYVAAPQGLNWFEATAADGRPGVQLAAGRSPRAAGEIVLDTQTFQASGMSLGEPVIVVLPRGTEITATLVGVAQYGPDAAMAPRGVWFITSEAQRLFLDGRDVYTGAWVTTDPDVDSSKVRSRVAAGLPDGLEASTGERAAALSASRLLRALAFVDSFVLVFVAIALVAAAFLIVNSFAVVIAGRAQELAVLRMLGASRTQVSWAVVFEALVTGLLGSALGVPAGIGLALVSGTLTHALDLTADGIVPALDRPAMVGFALGLGITLAAAVRPARLAGRVDPIAVLSNRVATGEDRLGMTAVLSTLLALGGGAALAAAIVRDLPYEILVVGGGALALLTGVTAASPVLGRPLLATLGLVWQVVFGIVGRLAHLNIRRQPRRTATMASALTIGMSLVATVAVLGASTTASLNSQVRELIPTDYHVHHVRYSPLDAAVVDEVTGIDGVADVHVLQRTVVSWAGKGSGLMVQDPESFGRVFDLSLTKGRVPTQPNEVVVDEAVARDRGVRINSEIEVTLLPRREPLTLTITGLLARSDGSQPATMITVPETLAAAGVPSETTLIGIDLRDGADPMTVRASLDQVLAGSPMLKILDRQRVVDEQSEVIERLFALVDALLALSVIVALLGIVNTLSLSVSERTREIGLLRAVGLTRLQLGWMIRLEAVSVAVLGCALGVAIGVLVGSAVRQALAGQGLTMLAIPERQLAGVVLVSAVLGIIAAAWPARLAARLDVVKAISAE
jgi:putative ABC transport system permease protein